MRSRIVEIDHARIERGETTFRFPMTLATQGEASDGHILSIAGGDVPARMPLLMAHQNDPKAALGSVVSSEKELRARPPRLRALGEIELTGEGPTAEIRRDVALMIERGHIRGVSIRWDADKGTPRTSLPSAHPAHIDEKEESLSKRYGLFFDAWRALEGSVVAVGADPKALIGRADETRGDVSEFWRAFAMQTQDERPAAIKLLADVAEDAREMGCAEEDILNAVYRAAQLSTNGDELVDYEFDGRRILLPARVLEILKLAPAPAPVPAPVVQPSTRELVAPAIFDTEKVVSILEGALGRMEKQLDAAQETALARFSGRILR